MMPNAKSFFPETHSRYIGTYWGQVSTPFTVEIVEVRAMLQNPALPAALQHGRHMQRRQLWPPQPLGLGLQPGWCPGQRCLVRLQAADAYLFAGAVQNDYTSVGYSLLLKAEKMVDVSPDQLAAQTSPILCVRLVHLVKIAPCIAGVLAVQTKCIVVTCGRVVGAYGCPLQCLPGTGLLSSAGGLGCWHGLAPCRGVSFWLQVQEFRVTVGAKATFGCINMSDFLHELAKEIKANSQAFDNYQRM